MFKLVSYICTVECVSSTDAVYLYNMPSERTYPRKAILHDSADRKFLEMYKDRKQMR